MPYTSFNDFQTAASIIGPQIKAYAADLGQNVDADVDRVAEATRAATDAIAAAKANDGLSEIGIAGQISRVQLDFSAKLRELAAPAVKAQSDLDRERARVLTPAARSTDAVREMRLREIRDSLRRYDRTLIAGQVIVAASTPGDVNDDILDAIRSNPLGLSEMVDPGTWRDAESHLLARSSEVSGPLSGLRDSWWGLLNAAAAAVGVPSPRRDVKFV